MASIRRRHRRVRASRCSEIERAFVTTRIVRQLKIRATIFNAKYVVETAQGHGHLYAWMKSLRGLSDQLREKVLRAKLSHCGPNTIFYFLLEAGGVQLNEKPSGLR